MVLDGSELKLRRRVAVVDDDAMFRESLGLNLGESGFEVLEFAGGRPFLDWLGAGNGVDAVLLDWRMPGMDGLAVLRSLRERGVRVPVVFLTALSDDIYEEAALRFGAVDFIEKSRSLAIILQRLRLITEGAKPTASSPPAPGAGPTLKRGRLELKTDIARAFYDGQPVDLTVTEFNIVCALAAAIDADVSYRQIYDLARGADFVAGQGEEGYRVNVRSFIKRIRQKFRAVAPEFDSIANYPGFGYRWVDPE
jgi:two-component system response regulator ChvI